MSVVLNSAEDLNKFNTESKQLLKDQDSLFKNLFVTEDENAVIEQFEREKHEEIERELGTKVKMPEVKQGWNEWAGAGVNQNLFKQKVERAERVKQQKIAELKKNRFDAKMKGVIVNSEDRDKKFAQKYWIKELPHNFRS